MRFSNALARVVPILALVFVPMFARAFEKPVHDELPNFDKRHARVPDAAAKAPEQIAVDQLKARVPGLRVDRHEVLRTPQFIGSTHGFLSGPKGEGQAITPARAAGVPANDPHRPIKAFLNEHAAAIGHSAEPLAGAKLKRDFTTRRNGLRTVVWEQRLDDIGVFEGYLIGNMTSRGELVNLSSQFVPEPEQAANVGTPNRAVLQVTPIISVRQAIATAAESIGENVETIDVAPLEAKPVGAEKQQRFKAGLLPGEARAKLVWLPMERMALHLCWQIELTRRAGGERYRVLVDATTGEAHARHCLTLYLSDASYRVFTGDSPSPFSPGYSSPNTNQPPLVPRSLVTLSVLNTNASPLGWIADGENETRGNNVDAHLDRDADDLPDLPRPQGSPFRVFDPPLDLTQSPNSYGDAAAVQLFYWCNWAHDRLYELGFDEASGNYQKDNFGRGGLGNDAIQADAQDGSGVNNANFTPSADGEAGRIQMFVWSGPNPDRDGDFDVEIILHEFVHGLSTRLVGGGVGISQLQAGGMGEGWSDFYALCLLSDPADDPNGVYPFGAYATYQLVGLDQNYYFGIRRYPYCTDLTKNPLTFKDLDSAQISPHDGVPSSPIFPFNPLNAGEVHAQGEFWCVTLWEARANLIRKHGPSAGNQLILQLVTDGMKLSPPNPNYVQARDAIIQADFVDNNGENFVELWAAFAKRGLGFSASAATSATTAGIVEAFDLPDAVLLTPPNGFVSGGPVAGPFAPACKAYSITNIGSAAQTWIAQVSQPWLTVTPAAGTLAPGRATNFTVCLNRDAGALGLGVYADTLVFSNASTHVVQKRPVQVTITTFATVPFSDGFESGRFESSWSVAGTGPFRTLVTSDFVPRTDSYHVTFDSAGAGQNARNELTLGLDLAGYTNVVLRFWAKGFGDEPEAPPPSPFMDGADFDGVAISADGTHWYEVQSLRDLTNGYSEFVVDLDAITLAYGLAYNSTFRIRFNQYDNFGIPFDGITIDDVSITGLATTRLRLQVPPTADEGSGVLTHRGLVSVGVPVVADLMVNLVSSDPSRVTVPASVRILAGTSNVMFSLAVPDNSALDGPQPVTITAASPGYFTSAAILTVHDDEATKLKVEVPKKAREGDGLLKRAGELTLKKKPAKDILVSLRSSAPESVRVPPGVLVPAGSLSAKFDLTVPENNRLEKKRSVMITAQVENWNDDDDSIEISDNDEAELTVLLPTKVGESNGKVRGAGLVRLSGTLATNLTIAFKTSDRTRLLVPASVVIVAGQTSTNFDLTVVDNALREGSRTVKVTAVAPGFDDGTSSVSILDDETPPTPFGPNPPHLSTNHPLSLALKWNPVAGEILINGGFEAGDLTGWHQENEGFGGFVINDGKLDPPGPDGPSPAFAGQYGVVTVQDGAGTHVLYQDVAIPPEAQSATVSWVDRIRNHAPQFAQPNQQFRVEIRDTANNVLATAFATKTGDPQTNDWTARSFDLSYLRGRTVRLTFVTSDNLGYFNVHLDNVSVTIDKPGATTYDLYFGTKPVPGTNEFVGTLSNANFNVSGLALTTPYYWQVVARRGAAATRGPVWQFTTRGLGAVHHFEIGRVFSPAFLDRRFAVTVTAKDDLNNTVKHFAGTATLTGLPGAGTRSSVLITEVDPGQMDRAEFMNVTPGNIDLSGWQIAMYDAIYWPSPVSTLTIPNGTISRPGEIFQLIDNGVSAGRYPVFYALTNIFWNNTAISNTMAVLVRDAAGNIVDFVCGSGADPGVITAPTRIPAEEWMGHLLPPNPDSARTYQRFGNADRHDASDWVIAPGTFGTRNPNLVLPVVARDSIALTPKRLTNFVTGIWAGYLTVQEPSLQMTLRAEDGLGHAGLSNPFAVVATNDLALTLSGSPGQAIVGGNVTYTLRVTNVGPGKATGLLVTNVLPPEMTFVSATASQGGCTNADGLIWCDVGSLLAANSAVVTIVATARTAGTFTNSALVAHDGANVFPGNNAASVVTAVNFPLLTSLNINITEGNRGTNNAVFTVRLSAASPLPASVNYATTNGEAMAGSDYLAVSDVLVFPPGTISQTIIVPVLGDTFHESGERFFINLFNATNAVIGTPQVRGRIFDDDPIASLSINDATVLEGPAGATVNAVFTVSLTAASGLPVLVNFATTSGSASAGRDYVPLVGTLLLEPGVTNLAITVPVKGDNLYEPAENFFIHLSDPFNALLGRAQGVGMILDDDGGALDHFAWSTVPTPQYVNAPFTATVTARDVSDNTVSNFTGTIALKGLAGGRNVSIGEGATNAWAQPMGTLFHDDRTQVIYLASELGGAGKINALSLFVSAVPGQTMMNWTLRLKHTAMSSYAKPAWESNGWTTVYQKNEVVGDGGWVTFFFESPFDYDGRSNLLVDFSFNNRSYTGDGLCRYFTTAQRRAIYFQTDSAFGDPLNWSGTNLPPPVATNRVPVIRLAVENPISITPVSASPFVNGVWTGRITALAAATNMFLRALDSDGHVGIGNTFAVDSGTDSNNDGLPDAWEIRFFGSVNSPGGGATDDPDGDGATNQREFLAGTNPNDAASTVKIVSVALARGDVQIKFTSVAGKSYRVERAADVAQSNWLLVSDDVAGSGGLVQVIDPGASSQSSRFYRVRVVP